ncbi:LANCL3 [Cordylochernes scorpioides]|nr:LANCL3 [Cordylochernes scorpioides]
MATNQLKRYFLNKMIDFDDAQLSKYQMTKDVLKKKVLEIINRIFDRQRTSVHECDGGLYVGITGVAYMCYYVGLREAFDSYRFDWLEKAEDYLNKVIAYIEHPRYRGEISLKSSFLLGNAGIYSTSALVMNELGEKERYDTYINNFARLACVMLPINLLKNGSDEFFVGRAGYICGALNLNRHLKKEIIPLEHLHELCKSIVHSGRRYAQEHQSPTPLMYAYYDTEYIGAAHGISAILQMLIATPNFLDNHPDMEEDIKATVDYLVSLKLPSGNYPCAMDEVDSPRPEQEELVHWCHGAAGIVYLLARAFLRWHEEKYLQACLDCGELLWSRGLLRRGPGICHGVAGSGYVFLMLYRLTHHTKYLLRAHAFASFLFTEEFKRARTPDSPYSLFEGLSGTACFLADLMYPEKAAFPFFNVFD